VSIGQGAADYLLAAESALRLVGRVEVARHWDRPSALPQMTVGAVAAHLGTQVLSVHAALTAGEGVTLESPVPLLEHYDRVAWVRADLDDDANVTIREGAERSATTGHDAVVRRLEAALADLRLAFASMELPPAVTMPWWDWSVSFPDYLVTRTMEIVVHSDDLAVSVDIEPPALPERVLGPVLALLVGISLRRHGQAAVVRGLSRRERAGNISAF
jgi:hypothetical protein